MAVFMREAWLDAATSPQTTDAVEVAGATAYGLQAVATGSPSNAVVRLEGSLDGVTWSPITANTSFSTSAFFWEVDKPVKYLRLNLSTLTGGSSPTVTASVIAV